MTPNQQLITTFYEAFQKRDYKTMQNCYGEKAVFSDPVFVDLNADEVRAMWEMLCVRGKDLQLEFSNIQADETSGSAEWKATYTFSKTKRKVVNHIKANFAFADGKIIEHTDHFDFYKWASQALGLPGILLGWTSLIKAKVRKEGMKNLKTFMNTKQH